MAVQFNPNVSNLYSTEALKPNATQAQQPNNGDGFGKAIEQTLNKVNDQHTDSNQSIVDLLSGKQKDVNSVVADVAKADMSFKLLVGVRNKLVEAYKETMRMQI